MCAWLGRACVVVGGGGRVSGGRRGRNGVCSGWRVRVVVEGSGEGCVWWEGGKGVCGGGREGGRVRVVVVGCMCVVVEGRGEGCVWWCKGVCGGARVCVVHMWNGVSEN